MNVELSRSQVIPSILQEHLDELDFLWEQRERFVFSSEWTLKELAAHEERAEAHLDGLRIGSGHSVDLARSFLFADESGVATAATFVMMAFEHAQLEREVLEALKTSPPSSRDGIRIGLRHGGITRFAGELSEIAVSAEPALRIAAIDLLAFHRLPAPKGISMLLSTPDPDSRRLVYEAAGRFGGPWGTDVLLEALESPSPVLRAAALRTSARVGMLQIDQACRRAATRKQDPVPEALTFLGLLGNAEDLLVLQNSLTRPALASAALAGMGKLGSIAAIPTLLEAMGEERLALDAGKAFIRITAATDIEASKPIAPPEGLTEDAIDAWDTTFPPDPAKARSWWAKEKGRFTSEGRWQSGRDVSKTLLGEHFNALPLESRLDLYLGARARDPERTPDLELVRRVKAQIG